MRHKLHLRPRIGRFISRDIERHAIHILSANPTSDDAFEHSSFILFFADFFNYVLAGADHDGCSHGAFSDTE